MLAPPLVAVKLSPWVRPLSPVARVLASAAGQAARGVSLGAAPPPGATALARRTALTALLGGGLYNELLVTQQSGQHFLRKSGYGMQAESRVVAQ